MSYTPAINTALIQQWLSSRADADQIREELSRQGLEEATIEAHLKEFRKQRFAKRQAAAFIYLGVGAFTGFVSCVLSMINPVPALYGVILYGLTSVAIGLAFYGLYLLLD